VKNDKLEREVLVNLRDWIFWAFTSTLFLKWRSANLRQHPLSICAGPQIRVSLLLYKFLFLSPPNLVVSEDTMKACGAEEEPKWFLTLELYVGELGALSPGQFKPVPFHNEAGWPPEPVRIIKKKIMPLAGTEPRFLCRLHPAVTTTSTQCQPLPSL
jgi:hypothetical protein